jgi:hypothetical protein
MTFSYTRFPVNKIKIEKIFKIMRKSLFNYSFYSHPEIWKFQGVTVGPTNLVLPSTSPQQLSDTSTVGFRRMDGS